MKKVKILLSDYDANNLGYFPGLFFLSYKNWHIKKVKTKKEKEKKMNNTIIKGNGITFYKESPDSDVCIDIDVDAKIDTFQFVKNGDIRSYKLKESKKCFPNVKKIVIPDRMDIDIPNSLFPNVREVDCVHYGNYKSGKVLVREASYYTGAVLINTFFHQEDEAVDLKGACEIADGAFEGCESIKLTNAAGIRKCSNQAFRNSAIGRLRPEKGKALLVGPILVDFDNTTEEIIIPDNKQTITAVREGLNFENVKTITINKIQSLINIQDSLPADIKVVLNEKKLIDKDMFSAWRNIPEVELCDENPYYKSIDGAIYTKDGSTIVKYPSLRHGDVSIPEGVNTIASNAFCGCKLKKVAFPSTMRTILPRAFYNCPNLEKIDFGTGIEDIGLGHGGSIVSQCPLFKELELPSQVRTIAESAFEECDFEQVKLNEGLVQIYDNVFKTRQQKKRKITLPASLLYIGAHNFYGVHTVILNGNHIPYGLVSAITLSYIDQDYYDTLRGYIQIETPEKRFFLPKYIATDVAKKIDADLAVPSFRDIYGDKLYDYGLEVEIKQQTAFAAYYNTPTDALKTYLRRTSKSFITKLMDAKDEKSLVEFVKVGILTPKMLNDTLKLAKEHDMTTLMAYILKVQQDSEEGKTSFRL